MDSNRFNSSPLCDYRGRTVALSGNLTATDVDVFLDRLLRLHNDRTSNRPITLYLAASGGSLVQYLRVYDVLRIIDAPLRTVGFGSISGISSLLLPCGTPGARHVLPHTIVATTGVLAAPEHLPGAQIGLTPMQSTPREKGRELVLEHLDAILTHELHLSQSVVNAVFDGGAVYSAAEAVSLRLADSVIARKHHLSQSLHACPHPIANT